VHLFELFARQEVYDSLIGKMALFLGGPPAAPVFMAAMGYFLAHTRKTTAQLIFRGIKLFFGGLFLNIGLNLHLLIRIYQGKLQLNPLEYIFGVDIFLLAGLSMIVIALLRLIFRQHFWGYLLLAFLIAFITPSFPDFPGENSPLKYLFACIGGTYRWSYFPLLPWLAYPLLGYSFYLLNKQFLAERIKPGQKIILTILLGIGFAFSAEYATEISTALPRYYHHGIVFFGWTTLFLIFWSLLAAMLEHDFGHFSSFRYTKWLGRHVTAAYVFQWLIIGNTATAIFKTQGLAEVILWFIGIMLLTSLLVYLWVGTKNVLQKQFTENESYNKLRSEHPE
jgi:hypothetical protein